MSETPEKEEPESNKSEKEENVFVVEKILRKRTFKGRLQYFLKWEGFDDTENTWEPEMNLDCPELIADYYRREKVESNKRSIDQQEDSSKKTKRANDFGYERGLEIENILGATDVYGELMFLIKWQLTDKPELVPARIANVKSPQQVIRFYEDRLTWANTEENPSDKQ